MFFGRNFQNRKMASIDARDEEAEWEAASDSEAASAELTGAFARAAASTERGMAEAVAAKERLMAEAAQAQAPDAEWEAKRAEMVEHHAIFGCLLPWYESHEANEWVPAQRDDYAAGTMNLQRKALLEALPFWKWEPEFEVYLYDLAAFYQDYGRMPRKKGEAKVGLEDGFEWLKKQQKRYAGGMSEANKKKVEACGGPVAAAIMALGLSRGMTPSGPPGLCPLPPSAQLPQLPQVEGQGDRPVIRRFPKPTDDGDGDLKAAMSHEFEEMLLKAAKFYREEGRMPQKDDEKKPHYFKWLVEQKRDYPRKMPEELKQRVLEEGGPVAAFIMSKWQTPPKGGWKMNYGAPLSKHGLAQQRQSGANWP